MPKELASKRKRRPEELLAAEKHMRHEFTAFHDQLRALAANPQQPIRTALYEAVMVHLRSLCDFFSPPPNWKEDDILATDYGVPGQPLPPVLEQAREIANKQIVHLTYERNRLPEEGQALPWDEIREELRTLVDRFSWTSPGKPIRLDQNVALDATANIASVDLNARGYDPHVTLKGKP